MFNSKKMRSASDVEKAVDFYYFFKENNYCIKGLPKLLKIHRSTLHRWVKYRKENPNYFAERLEGTIKKYSQKTINKRTHKSRILEYIKKMLIADPLITSKTIRKFIKKDLGIGYSINHISKLIRGMKYTYKRVQKENVYVKGDEFKIKKNVLKNQIGSKDNYDIIAIDECGINLSEIGNYGRSLIGTKCIANVANKCKNHTLMCALSKDGILAYKLIEGAANSQIYTKFVIEDVLPKLKPNQKLLMDNAAIHKTTIFWKAVTQARFNKDKIIFNVPYSPKYNPIEYVFNTMKKKIRYSVHFSEDIEPFLNNFYNWTHNNVDCMISYFRHSFDHLFDDEEY